MKYHFNVGKYFLMPIFFIETNACFLFKSNFIILTYAHVYLLFNILKPRQITIVLTFCY